MAEFQSKFTGQEIENTIDKLRNWLAAGIDGTYPTVTISSVTYAVIWKSIPVSGTPCYGIGLHPTTGRIYEIYYNGSSYTATALDTDTKNTTGSSNSDNKLFIVGAAEQSATGVQTYSNSNAYIKNGLLYSGGAAVLTAHAAEYGKIKVSGGEAKTADSAQDTIEFAAGGNLSVARAGDKITYSYSTPNALKNPNKLNLKVNSETSNFVEYDGSATKTVTVKPSTTAGAFVISDGTTDKTIQLAGAFTDNDTKNTAGSSNSNSKLFIIGASTQAANPQTYSNSVVYTQNGKLYSNNTEVSVIGHTHSFDTITNRGEAFLSWGGKNFSGSYGPIDAAMVPELGANRLAFMPANAVTIEYSRDGGATWTDYGPTDSQKINLFNGLGSSFTIGKATSGEGNIATNKYQLRVNIYTGTGRVYTVLNKFVIYLSTSGTNSNWCTIRARKQSDYTANNDKWTTFADKISVSGWSGYNVINTSGITTYGNTASTQYGHIQFIFGCDTGSTNNSYAGLNINKIFGFGGVGWTTPSTMAKTGHMYTYDSSQNVTFPAVVSAKSFTENGTSLSNKYLGKTAKAADADKLDGNDSTYYLNLDNINDGSTRKLANYVPKSLISTKGDIIYASAASTPARLGIGSNGQFLSVDNGIPKWVDNPNADTKNTAGSTDSTEKLYLVGAKTQDNNPQTYSNSKVYIQNNKLYSNNEDVVTSSDLNNYLPLSGGTSHQLTAPVYIAHNDISFIGTAGAFGFRAIDPSGQLPHHLGQINLSKNFGGDGNQYGIQMSAVDITNSRFNQFRVYQLGIVYQHYDIASKTATDVFTVDTAGQLDTAKIRVAKKATMQYNSTEDCIEFIFA